MDLCELTFHTHLLSSQQKKSKSNNIKKTTPEALEQELAQLS